LPSRCDTQDVVAQTPAPTRQRAFAYTSQANDFGGFPVENCARAIAAYPT
jgi:hypothetical protein